MPTISNFYGIIIVMYLRGKEHNPPHIHALYGDEMAAIEIQTGNVLEGYLPPKALAMVQEWVGMYRDDLLRIWETQEFRKLSPLE